MNTFNIPVVRTVHQVKEIPVSANTYEEACDIALDQAGDHEFPSEKESHYSVADDNSPYLLAAASAFCSGDKPMQEYEKLLEASEQGNGDDEAATYALIWQPICGFSVDTVIGLIENHADVIKYTIQN